MISIQGIIRETVSRKIGNNEWNVIEVREVNNQILNTMLLQFSQLLGGNTPSPITKITFGSNETLPLITDSKAMMTNIYTKTLSSITYPTFNSVRFSYSLLEAEHNGNEIREYALTSDDNTIIFSRVIRGLIDKEADIKIDGTWDIITNIKGV